MTDPHLPAEVPARLHRLRAAGRALWLLLAAALVYFNARGLLLLLSAPLIPCVDPSRCTPAQVAAYLRQLDLNPDLVNGLQFALINVAIPLTYLGVALFIFWRGRDSAIALATATCLLFYGLLAGSPVGGTSLAQYPWGGPAKQAGLLAFAWAVTYMLLTFPNGQFVPRWSRWAVGVEWLILTLIALTTGLESPPTAVALTLIIMLGVSLQVYRYRRTATPTERQQIKWGLVGLTGFLLNSLLWVGWVVPSGPLGAEGLGVILAFQPLSVVLVLSLPVTLAIAVLRYRLWDIDVLIRRTLIYSALTAVLTGTYLGLVILLQALTGAIAGQTNSALVTVLSTLAIAALFAPVRGWVQTFVDQRFYRRKYDTAQTLAAFAMRARDEVNLDQLSAELRGAVNEAMQPAHIGLWLRG